MKDKSMRVIAALTVTLSLSFFTTFSEARDCSAEGRDQSCFDFDYTEPGRYQMAISSAYNKQICWVTWNEGTGTPPVTGASRGNWKYYGIDKKESDYSGVVHIDVPCPNGSFSISELIDANKSEEKDQKGKNIELLQKQLMGCIGGGARRQGYWVVVQASSKSACPSGEVIDSWKHPWGFERW